jgi:hypothetical protein
MSNNSNNNKTMSYLLFCKGVDGDSSTAVTKLQNAQTDASLKSICLDRIRIDESISQALLDIIWRRRTTKNENDDKNDNGDENDDETSSSFGSHHLDSLDFIYCKGKVDSVIDAIFRSSSPPPPPPPTSTTTTTTTTTTYTTSSTKKKTTIRRLSILGRNEEYLRVLLSLRNGLAIPNNGIELQELVIQAAITTAAAGILRDCISTTTTTSTSSSSTPTPNAPTNNSSSPSTTLSILDLSHCMLVHDSATAVLSHGLQNNQHLHTLRLSNCGLEDRQVATLIDSIRVSHRPSGATRIMDLSLPLNYCQTFAVQAISNLLKEPECGLQRLDMAQQFIDTDHCLNLLPIIQALRVNASLHFWDVRDNFLDDAHIAELARTVLVENQTLDELHLEGSDIGSQGIQALCQCIPHMKGLKRLWLKNNPFCSIQDTTRHDEEQEVLLLLLEGLKQNTTLHIVDLGLSDGDKQNTNETQNDIQRQISWYLCLNRGGRRMFQSSNTVPLSHWSVLLEQAKFAVQKEDIALGIQVHDIVYHLLQQGPVLLER